MKYIYIYIGPCLHKGRIERERFYTRETSSIWIHSNFRKINRRVFLPWINIRLFSLFFFFDESVHFELIKNRLLDFPSIRSVFRVLDKNKFFFFFVIDKRRRHVAQIFDLTRRIRSSKEFGSRIYETFDSSTRFPRDSIDET